MRPEMVVLPLSALIPPQNLVEPAPNRFRHVVKRTAAFYYGGHGQSAPAGELAVGTRVVILVDEPDGYCRVVDEHGKYIQVSAADLEPISTST